MNFSLKSIAVAVTLAVSAAGANAAIDSGISGNGELFFNMWDANGSYTLDLNTSISDFESSLAASGAYNQVWSDSNLATFLGGNRNLETLQWNVVAGSYTGEYTLLTTYSVLGATVIKNSKGAQAVDNITQFVPNVNGELGAQNSVIINDPTVGAYAGIETQMGAKLGNVLNFSTAGTLANNSYENGLNFLNAYMANNSTRTAAAYTTYADGAAGVKVWLGSDGVHIAAAAVPEPSEYAMLLAGLGMIGFMARRNKRA